MRLRLDLDEGWLQIALEWLHDVARVCFWEEAGARNLVFFRVKWLQPAMKGTSSVRRLRLRSFLSRIVPPMCFATSGCSCVRSSMRFLKLWWQIALEWLHDVARALFWGGSRSTKPCVFPCKVAAAGDERYLVFATVVRSFLSRIVPPMCFATSGCSCVRSSMSCTKPCVFPCKVAAAGDERYLVCAAVAAAVVSVANCSSYVCNEWLFLCA